MQSLSLLFAIISFTAAVGSVVVCFIRVIQWGKNLITAKAAVLSLAGYLANGFLQIVAGMLFYMAHHRAIGYDRSINDFIYGIDWPMFWVGMGISAFCTLCFYISYWINYHVPTK